MTVPSWINSAMDGFAVRGADIAAATNDRPVVLRVLGEVAAGRAPDLAVGDGTAIRIMTGAMLPDDKAWMDEALKRVGAVVAGRNTYEAAERWGDQNPWGLPFFIVTHRPDEQPDGDQFGFVAGVPEAIAQAKAAAGGKDVHVMGGADTIRQALGAGLVDECHLFVAPVIVGRGKPALPGDLRAALDLLDERRFENGVVYLRHRIEVAG